MGFRNPDGVEETFEIRRRKPFVLVEHGVRGTRITAANEAALQAGATTDQMLTDARAACPSILVEQANPQADADFLQRLALWSTRYTPMAAIDMTAAPDDIVTDFGLLLDTTGCDHLFGGEAAMMEDIARRLWVMGFNAHFAIAPTPGAAHALSRYGNGMEIARNTDEAQKLVASLPVEALRLDSARTILLRRLGLKTIRSVARVPRQALERRFRSRSDFQSVQLRLDQLTGALREPFTPLRPPAPWRAHMPCPDPALDITAVRFALGDLFERLAARMEEAGQGARGWQLSAFHADGGHSSVAIRLSRVSRTRAHVMHLFEDKLEQIDPGYGIDGFVLEACDCDAITASQTALVADKQVNSEVLAAEMSGLVDRLSNRFGDKNIYRAAPVKTHIPERAWRMVNAGNTVSWQEVEAQTAFRSAARPFRLFDKPEEAHVTASVPDGPPLNFQWRRQLHQIIRARGPERIAPEWWREGSRGTAIRDYYEVEDTKGHRYWLFREGLYGGSQMPGWFVHGVFG